MTRTMALIAAAASLSAPAAVQAAGPRLETSQGAIVLLEEDHAFPLVSISVTARTGSAADPTGKEGLAHLTAVLMRRGVRGKSADEIDELVDGMGAAMSVHVDHHSITIGGQVIRRNLEPFAELLSEMLTRPTFSGQELARLQRETVAEIVSLRDSDRDLAARFYRQFLFGNHAYARPPIGVSAGVRAIRRRDVQEFFRSAFVAENLVIGVAGDVTKDDLEDIIDDDFSDLLTGHRPRVRYGRPRMAAGRRVLLVDKPERTQTQVYIGELGIRARDPDTFPLTVANTVLGGTFTARLMKEVRSKRGWSYGASSRLGRGIAREAFTMWTFPAARDAVACIQLELQLLESFVRDGITQSELNFAKSYLVGGFAFEIDTADKRLEKRIDAEVLRLGPDYYRTWLDRIRAVDLPAANRAIREHIQTEDLAIVLVATAADLRERLQAEVPGVTRVEVVPFDRD